MHNHYSAYGDFVNQLAILPRIIPIATEKVSTFCLTAPLILEAL